MDYFDYDGVAAEFETGSDSWDIQSFLEESQERSQELLENELERIEDELEGRDRINSETMTELESKLDWYLERLEAAYNTVTGASNDVDELKEKVEDFYESIRREKRRHWLDRQELENERRQVIQEVEELGNTDEVLEELI